MVFEHIEKLKHEYTDKFVVVDDGRPELRRFSGLTGLVKTVNMNGNALVEFEGLNNIGWYDIEVDFLKVVDQPVPKEPASKPAKATAAPKKAPVKKPVKQEASALTKARTDDGKKGAAMSVEDVLAAARGGESSTAAKPAAKSDPSKMSVEDVLAAARGNAPAAKSPAAKSPAAKSPAAKSPAAKSPAAADKKEEAASSLADQLEAARKPKSAAAGGSSGSAPSKIDPKKMSIEEILAAAQANTPAAPAETKEAPAETKEAPAETEEAPTESEAAPAADGPLPTDTQAIIEFCQQRDAS